jgi:Uma2 family endonuclease
MTGKVFTPTDDQAWPAQGEWTYEDYLRLPDDGRRYEIIEGVLYMVNAPNYEHQFIVTQLLLQLGGFVQAQNLGLVLTAPFEVHLSPASRPVQPDLVFIKAASLPNENIAAFEGAPDLVVEVLSPASLRTDRHIKFDAYERAGIPEYWIINPKTRSIEVYILSGGEYALQGEFLSDDVITSQVLVGLKVVTAMLFPFPPN